MPFDGVILYGPPASGKDSVTAELCALNSDYAYFEKLKAGEGRTSGYRLVAEDRLVELRNRGLIVHEVARYGSNYAIDASHLDELFKGGRVPVVHMGQVAGVNAMRKYGARWLNVLLWCSRDVAVERLRMRGSVDVEERLAVWDATLAVLRTWADPRFTLSIRTDAVQPAMAAAIIHAAMSDRAG